jgi:hypothetical protein
MPYQVTRSNGSIQTIQDNVIDTNKYTISIQGRGAYAYGQPYANALVNMLEHFAAASPPKNPIPGQLWFNTNIKALLINKGIDDNNPEWETVGYLGAEGDPIPSIFVTTIGSYTTPVANVFGGTFHGTATSAIYADLAERYESDFEYTAGTVVMFGGEKEITESDGSSVFSVISTNPAYSMNTNAGDDKTHPFVVLHGRAPVKVIGDVKKHDMLVASSTFPGFAEVAKEHNKHLSFARALVDGNDIVECYIKAGI